MPLFAQTPIQTKEKVCPRSFFCSNCVKKFSLIFKNFTFVLLVTCKDFLFFILDPYWILFRVLRTDEKLNGFRKLELHAPATSRNTQGIACFASRHSLAIFKARDAILAIFKVLVTFSFLFVFGRGTFSLRVGVILQLDAQGIFDKHGLFFNI